MGITDFLALAVRAIIAQRLRSFLTPCWASRSASRR
jgi:hypothetical protein